MIKKSNGVINRAIITPDKHAPLHDKQRLMWSAKR